MLASLTNAKFAVPENPVMRPFGMGALGYAMGQPVIMSSDPSATIGDTTVQGGLAPGQNGAFGSDQNQYSLGPNGQLQYNQIGPNIPGDQYTASYCNSIINGGSASPADT